MTVDLSKYDNRGYTPGRGILVRLLWYVCNAALFTTWLLPLSGPKRRLLRMFGARIGDGVVIKPRVNIHFPWKLSVGEHAWIGEEVFILNLEPVSIGDHCCISQRVFLCTGNHDFRQPAMPYRNAPIIIADGAWVGAQSFVAPGVTIAEEAVVAAGSVVTKNQPTRMVCGGNPCVPLTRRWS